MAAGEASPEAVAVEEEVASAASEAEALEAAEQVEAGKRDTGLWAEGKTKIN